MVGREFYGGVQKNSLRKHLRHCRDNICECLASYMDRMEGEVNSRADTMLHPNSVRSGMGTHRDQMQGRQGGMEEAMDMYDEHCRGPNAPAHAPIPQSALDAMNRPIPTIDDWEAENGGEMPEGNYTPGAANQLQSPRDTGILNNPEPSTFSREAMAAATGLTGAALTAYIIVSVGSRFLYPPRNFVPVP